MDPKIVEKITQHTSKRFPEIIGRKPTIRRQSASDVNKGSQPKIGQQNYLLTYKFNASGPTGQKIPRWVRVVATQDGKILKVTTSK